MTKITVDIPFDPKIDIEQVKKTFINYLFQEQIKNKKVKKIKKLSSTISDSEKKKFVSQYNKNRNIALDEYENFYWINS